MTLVAAIPWYDHPASADALDVFWRVVRARLDGAGFDRLPDARARGDVSSRWSSASLLLTQCCGPDLFTHEGAMLEPVARPVFADLDV